MGKGKLAMALLATALWPGPANADDAKVLKALAHFSLSYNGEDLFSISATIAHTDTGEEHYANKFDILSPDGTILGTRILAHPHVDEQPFTRSVGSVSIPANVTHVVIRASDNVHGLGKQTVAIELPERD